MEKLSLCSVMRIRSEVDGRATTCDTREGNKTAAFFEMVRAWGNQRPHSVGEEVYVSSGDSRGSAW